MHYVKPIAEWCVAILEIAGIAAIVIAALYATLRALILLLRPETRDKTFHEYRRTLGEGILLGLEFLVGADIIDTVALELTYESAAVLAAIVLIRTFLSFTLQLETSGRWPWQQKT